MNQQYFFPFGQPLKRIEQVDKRPKKTFVLGVYASAVHASWVDNKGKLKVNALAVASEPEIFWTGESAETIISAIQIPNELGRLTIPRNRSFNGPSGRALDEKYLDPLGLSRNDAWLSDLLPEARINPNQRKAIERTYTEEVINKHNLNPATIPDFKASELNCEKRRKEILDEIEMSQAERIVLLGDLSIKWFLKFYNRNYSKLSDFVKTEKDYGREHEIEINGKTFKVLPLCHPRQADRLGSSSWYWGRLHDNWVRSPKL